MTILKLNRLPRPLVLLAGAVLLMTGAGCSDRRAAIPALLEKSVSAARAGNWQVAEAQALAALKHDPRDSNALLLSAIAAEHLGDEEKALNNARAAADGAPGDYPAQYTYGRMLAKHPEFAKEAMTPLERALKARPGDRNALILLGECASCLNDDRAIDYYNALPEPVRKMPEIQTRIAVYYLDRRSSGNGQENLNRAFTALSNAWKSAPENPGIVLNLALFFDHYTTNQKKTAQFYKSYLFLTEHNPELNPTRAQVQSRLTKLGENGTRNNRRR